jgi:hypothetical protein
MSEKQVLNADLRAELKGEIEALEQAAYEKGKAEGLAQGKAEGFAQGKAEGATTERDRIRAIEAVAMPGHEALIAEMKFDGKTTGPEAAVRILAAEKEKRGKVLTDLKADAPNPVPHTDAPVSPEGSAAPAETVEQARKAGLVR